MTGCCSRGPARAPLRNRVTPEGHLEAAAARGTVMGNRGVLHDEARRIVRPFRGRRWIVCRLQFRGRQREVMTPGRWTELFFLDDAVALAAGHRPCAQCRRADHVAFRAAWSVVHPQDDGPVTLLDDRLHAQRTAVIRPRVGLARLPDGAMVLLDGRAWLVRRAALLAWSHAGYTDRRARPARGTEAELLTPPSTVAVLAAGWQPALHPSAG